MKKGTTIDNLVQRLISKISPRIINQNYASRLISESIDRFDALCNQFGNLSMGIIAERWILSDALVSYWKEQMDDYDLCCSYCFDAMGRTPEEDEIYKSQIEQFNEKITRCEGERNRIQYELLCLSSPF